MYHNCLKYSKFHAESISSHMLLFAIEKKMEKIQKFRFIPLHFDADYLLT